MAASWLFPVRIVQHILALGVVGLTAFGAYSHTSSNPTLDTFFKQTKLTSIYSNRLPPIRMGLLQCHRLYALRELLECFHYRPLS